MDKCLICNKPILEYGFCDEHSTNKMLGLVIVKSNDLHNEAMRKDDS